MFPTFIISDRRFTPIRSGSIEDGFLAPYKVVKVHIDVDVEGYRPERGYVDRDGNEIEDRIYNTKDFDRTLVIDDRTKTHAAGYSETQPAPHAEKTGARTGWVQHLPALPHYRTRDGGSSSALQHTWSGHAKSHVSEVYKKLLKKREWCLRWAEKAGTGFTLPGHQEAAAEVPNGKSGKILEFRKVC
jgi:hypothetical protein